MAPMKGIIMEDDRPSIVQASNELSMAMAKVRGAAERYVEAHMQEGDIENIAKIIWQNRSDWSGGPYNTSNIVEWVVRETAINAIGRVKRRA